MPASASTSASKHSGFGGGLSASGGSGLVVGADRCFSRSGNQTAAGSTIYTYDLADRLVSAKVGNVTETYTWSGDGIRLSAATGSQSGKTVRFVVDRTLGQPSVVVERDGAGKTLRRYGYGLDLVSQTTPTKGPYWYHHDGLGSVTDITSTAGASLAWAEYQPFGLVRAAAATSAAPVNPFGFTGEYRDGVTGLLHLRARQYDPASGRFTATDPVSPAAGEPYVSAYAYVANNPVRWVDPSGRCLQNLILAAFGPPGAAAGAGLTVGCVTALLLGTAAISTSTYLATQGVPDFPVVDIPGLPPLPPPTGTLQEPRPAPQPLKPPIETGPRCSSERCRALLITGAGATIFWFYHNASKGTTFRPAPAPTPVPAPPPSGAAGK